MEEYIPESAEVTFCLTTPEELIQKKEQLSSELAHIIKSAFPSMSEEFVLSDVADFFISPEKINGASRFCLLYKIENRIIGGRVFDVLDVDEGKAVYLINQFLSPDYQKHGFGMASTQFILEHFRPAFAFSTAAQSGTNRMFMKASRVMHEFNFYPNVTGSRLCVLPKRLSARVRSVFAALYLGVCGSEASVEKNLAILDANMVRRGYNKEDLYGRNPWDKERDPIARVLFLSPADGVLWVILAT